MIVDIEVLALSAQLRDMGMAEQLAHDMTVLAFHQGVVVAVPGAGLGDTQFLQQPGTRRLMYSEPAVEPPDDEREARQQVCHGMR